MFRKSLCSAYRQLYPAIIPICLSLSRGMSFVLCVNQLLVIHSGGGVRPFACFLSFEIDGNPYSHTNGLKDGRLPVRQSLSSKPECPRALHEYQSGHAFLANVDTGDYAGTSCGLFLLLRLGRGFLAFSRAAFVFASDFLLPPSLPSVTAAEFFSVIQRRVYSQ